eukprot:3268012-Alexandrium_andersonii.AAC.1
MHRTGPEGTERLLAISRSAGLREGPSPSTFSQPFSQILTMRSPRSPKSRAQRSSFLFTLLLLRREPANRFWR